MGEREQEEEPGIMCSFLGAAAGVLQRLSRPQ